MYVREDYLSAANAFGSDWTSSFRTLCLSCALALSAPMSKKVVKKILLKVQWEARDIYLSH